MSNNIVQFNEEIIKGQIKELVRGSVEETLNELLEAEAEKLTQAARYERSVARQGYRSGHYDRNLTTTSGDVTLHVPRLKGISFETAIIERYRRRESSVEEALIEMYLAGVSVRRVEDITEALWGSKVSASTISELNKKAYVNIEAWRNRPLQGGKYLMCMWTVSTSSETGAESTKMKNVVKMLKAIHAQESKKASREKAAAVVAELRSMKLPEAAKKVEAGIEETLTYCDFPSEHWTKIRTNNVIERMNREIRRRTRVVGAFPDGNSALMLVCARLRHVAGTQWGNKKYMNMKHLEAMEREQLVG